MSAAIPHFVRVVDAPGQPPRFFQCLTKKEAFRIAGNEFDEGYTTVEVAVFRGSRFDNIDRDPIKVWT